MIEQKQHDQLRLLSVCTGIGGADLAAQWTGAIEIAGQIEIDAFCLQVLEQHWPHVKRLRDLKEVQGDEFGRIDLMVAGLPCQPFSSAGKQHGTNDDRYLWPEMLRIVKAIRPSWVLLENVDDFTYMALDIVQADLESQGYAVQAFVLPACATGAPHIRERCFVVAYSNRLGESGQESASANGQCSTTLPTGLCQWTHTTNVADATSPRLPKRGSTHILPNTAQESSGVELQSQRCGDGNPQSRMGRVFDGVSARLDGARWPSEPSREQQEWEPPRTVTGRQPYRRKRLKALGNAIVPHQIYPFFQLIVAYERVRI